MTSKIRGQLTYLDRTYDLSGELTVSVIEGKIAERTNFLEIDRKVAEKMGRRGLSDVFYQAMPGLAILLRLAVSLTASTAARSKSYAAYCHAQ